MTRALRSRPVNSVRTEFTQGGGRKKISKSRIKRLRGLDRPQYRLRVDEVRVFHDVEEDTVQVLAIVPKAQADAWLETEGTPSKTRGPREGEG